MKPLFQLRVPNMGIENRYEILDGLRGIAAIGVMLFHLSILGLHLATHGYLAVDFFFVLSGFVMAHAYGNRLPEIGIWAFIRLRFIRIMPLSLFGLLLGSAYFLLRYTTQSQSLYSLGDIVSATFLNLFLLPKPWMSAAPTDTIFPSNTPLWSLSLEMMINIVWAIFLLRTGPLRLAGLIVLSAIALVFFTLYHGNADLGATWPTYLGGVSRVVFGFIAGLVVWRYRLKPRQSALYALFAALALASVFFVPDFGPWFDIAAIIFAFPLIVWLATSTTYGPERRLFRLVGEISYPLYVVHVPIFMFVAGLAKLAKYDTHTEMLAGVAVTASILAAIGLDRLYDRPVRRALSAADARWMQGGTRLTTKEKAAPSEDEAAS